MHSSPPIPERLNRTLIRGWNEGGVRGLVLDGLVPQASPPVGVDSSHARASSSVVRLPGMGETRLSHEVDVVGVAV